MHLRFALILLVLLSSHISAWAEGEITTSRSNVKGEVPVRFSHPKVNTVSEKARSFVVSGSAAPGTIIIVKGQRSILVPGNGRFGVNIPISNSPTKLQLQAVSPKGSRSIYAFDVPKAGPSQEEIEKQEQAEKEKEEAEKAEQLKAEEEKLAQEKAEEEKKIAEEKLAKEKKDEELKAERKRKRDLIRARFPDDRNEISIGVTALLAAQPTMMPVAGLRLWPDSILGAENGILSKHRWGLGANYGQTSGGSLEYNFLEAPLMYRIVPGPMNRSTILAIGPSYLAITHAGINWTGIGANIYYGTSMPKFMASLVNWIPFLKVPMYLEFEAFYGAAALSTDVTSSGVYALKLRSKFFFTKRFFGDLAGIMRSHTFAKGNSERTLTMFGAYGGIGFLF